MTRLPSATSVDVVRDAAPAGLFPVCQRQPDAGADQEAAGQTVAQPAAHASTPRTRPASSAQPQSRPAAITKNVTDSSTTCGAIGASGARNCGKNAP